MTRSTYISRATAALGATAVALATLVAAPAPVGGAPPSAAQQPPGMSTQVWLWVDAGPDPEPLTAYLTCRPTGGTHPRAEAACRALDEAAGDLTQLPGEPDYGPCDDMYRPVTATAFGWWGWQFRLVWFSNLYAHPCDLRRHTGLFFEIAPVPPTPAPAT